MKYTIITSSQFKKDLKRCQKRGLNMRLIYDAISILAANGKLPRKYKPHQLKGTYNKLWECHIQPNWLMIWEKNEENLTLLFVHTGTHSDLFKE
ncbi:MAG: type II toxin-antitoxin system YafQ family toxin [Prevotella sp.]|nr:type II toxin-antitoxin system YafQ family toxin [Prevotella sp.]